MATFKHILFATDFGDQADHAEAFAVHLANDLDAKLTVVHVVTFPAPVYAEALAWPVADLEQAGREALAAALTRIAGKHAKTETVLQTGYPAERIVATVEKLGVDLVVIGTHGRRGLARMVLGSVAERVLRMSPVPVLAIPPEEK